MSLVKNVQSVEEYNTAIAGEGLGKLSREQRGHHFAPFLGQSSSAISGNKIQKRHWVMSGILAFLGFPDQRKNYLSNYCSKW